MQTSFYAPERLSGGLCAVLRQGLQIAPERLPDGQEAVRGRDVNGRICEKGQEGETGGNVG